MFPKTIINDCIKIHETNIRLLKKLDIPDSLKLGISSCDLLKKTKVKALLELIAGKPVNVIYIFTIEKNKVAAVRKAALKYWKNKRKTHLSQLNIKSRSSCLYVGSKIKGLKGRFKQHIGTKNKRTYAMHLKSWITTCNVNIGIEHYSFGDSVKRDVLQILENALWDYYHPLLGKRGAK